jgi:spermidine/putrescine transport system substrate-binding protein
MNDNWRPNGDFRALLSRPNRRQLIRGTGAVAGAAALSGVMPAPSRAEGETLNLLSWPGHGDAAVVKPFEDKYHVKVVAKEYVGGEAMLALINQSPPGSYDVVLADAEYVGMLRDGGFIEQLNPADYPFGDFWPEFQKFEGHWLDGKLYSVITRFGYLGLAYRTDVLSDDDVKSYKILWDPKVKGKVGFFDWYLPSMGCLSLYSGNKPPFDITDAAFAKLKQTLFSLKPESAGFYPMAAVFSSLTNGTTAVIPGVGDWVALLLAKNGVPVSATVPAEGGLQWTESLSICSSSPKKDLAKAFIQYMASPEGQVRTGRLPAYWASIPSKAGWQKMNAEFPADAKTLRHTFSERNVMDEYKEGKIFIRKTPVKQSIETWNEAWTEFKSL